MHGAALRTASIGLALAAFMQILDQTIANVSVPTIAGNLGVSPNQGTWVVTSFGVATAISLPLTGWLARRIGQVRLLRWSIILFVIASLLCGLATSLNMLVAARVLQGVVAGPMMPLSQAMLIAIYPPERRTSAMMLGSTVAVVAPIFGPLLGGYISDNLGWPWIFFINLPVGLIAATLSLRAFRGRETPLTESRIDIAGLCLLAVWVGAMQIMLDIGTDEGWFDSSSVVWLAVIAGVGFTYFIVWELAERHPVVDVRMFWRRNFVVGTVGMALAYSLFFGNAILVPLWLQTQMGYTASWAGVTAAPVSLIPLLLSRPMSRGLRNTDPRIFATAALLAFAAASFMRSNFTTQTDIWAVIFAQLMTGAGVAMLMVPMQTISLSGLHAHEIASATGLSNFVRVVAGSFGASIATTLWYRREVVHHAYLAESVSRWDPNDAEYLARLSERGLADPQAHTVLERMLSWQSHMLGAIDYFWASTWLVLAFVIMVWLARPPFTAGGVTHAASE